MKQILAIIKKQTVVIVFFLFLIVSLFLGDGKQPIVDVFWALGILVLYAFHYYQEGKLVLRALPRSITIAWAAFILYYIIRTLFSDSVGYSVTATARILEAYLLYILFYTISSERMVGFFEKCLIVVGAVAIIASWVFIAFPSLAGFLPLMNLLYATYGHNHLADFLLPIFPLVVFTVQKKPLGTSWFLFVFYVMGMLATFARGAWLMVAVYLLYAAVWHYKVFSFKYKAVIIAVGVVFFFLAGTLVYPTRVPSGIPHSSTWIARQLAKPSLLQDIRFKYWRQALLAINERPWFGSGPGTFYLQSLRWQDAPNSFSWFAHSFLLEQLVEVGLIGTALLTIVIFTCGFLLTRQRSWVNSNTLLWGCGLIFFYSLYEFNLDYLVLWVLFWSTLGLLMGRIRVDGHGHGALTKLLLGWLFVFYISSVGSSVVASMNQTTAFLLAPYSSDLTIASLRETLKKGIRLTSSQKSMVLLFHKKNPGVTFELAQIEEKMGETVEAENLYKETVDLDTQNTMYYSRYFSYLVKQNNTNNLARELRRTSFKRVPVVYHDVINKIDFQSPYLVIAYKGDIFEKPRNLSVIYYLLGVSVMKDDIWLTYWLWHLARDVYPDFGTFHVELASVEHYFFHNQQEAEAILTSCLQYPSPAQECGDYLQDGVPPPGTFEQYVRNL